jgi:tetratricopeptide (TPR) repeat protein
MVVLFNPMKARLLRLFFILSLVLGMAAGCAVPLTDREADVEAIPVPAPAPESEGAGAMNSPAVVELSSRARTELNNSRHDTASQLLERAIRIEPQNGVLWHELARVRYEQGQYEQARELAARSNALLTSDSRLKARNDALIEAAREALSY